MEHSIPRPPAESDAQLMYKTPGLSCGLFCFTRVGDPSSGRDAANNGIERMCPRHVLYCGHRWGKCWKSRRALFFASFLAVFTADTTTYSQVLAARIEKNEDSRLSSDPTSKVLFFRRGPTITEDASTVEPEINRFVRLSSSMELLQKQLRASYGRESGIVVVRP